MDNVFHDKRVASFYGGSVSLEFAKHVDLDAHEPNRLRHKGPIGSMNCPACTRDYVGKHRKDIVDCA